MRKIGLVLSIFGTINAASYDRLVNEDDNTRLISKKAETTKVADYQLLSDQMTPTTLAQAKKQIAAFCDVMNAQITAINTAGDAIAKCKTETDEYRGETYAFKFKPVELSMLSKQITQLRTASDAFKPKKTKLFDKFMNKVRGCNGISDKDNADLGNYITSIKNSLLTLKAKEFKSYPMRCIDREGQNPLTIKVNTTSNILYGEYKFSESFKGGHTELSTNFVPQNTAVASYSSQTIQYDSTFPHVATEMIVSMTAPKEVLVHMPATGYTFKVAAQFIAPKKNCDMSMVFFTDNSHKYAWLWINKSDPLAGLIDTYAKNRWDLIASGSKIALS